MGRQHATPGRMAATLLLMAAAVGCGDSASSPSRPVVTVFGNYIDRDADAFVRSLAAFERSTGIDVRYVGSASFEADVLERVRRGNPPDLAIVPQPGLLRSLASEGFALPYDDELASAATGDVDDRLVSLVTVDGEVFGSWYSVTPKSLVWYSPRQFRARGLEVPTTWDDLLALTDEIAASGTAPWCLGVRDGGATGWIATDWVEDLLLRFAGAEAYDQWVAHDLTFVDQPVVDAVQRFGEIALDGERVYGGSRAAVEYTVSQAANQLVGSNPDCLLHRQASFLTDLVDRRLAVSPTGDLWVFPFPGPADSPSAMVVGGSVVTRFTDRPEVRRLAAYLGTLEAAMERAKEGGFLSPLQAFPSDTYPAVLNRTLAEWTLDADVLRFDASDLMPPEVGVDAFWSQMTAWLGGARLNIALLAIDSAWPFDAVVPPLPRDRGSSDG